MFEGLAKIAGNVKYLKKFVAVFLVITIVALGVSLPINAAAENTEIYIVKELEQYRSEYSKTYLKSDGTLESVVSAHALHFKNSETNEWEEIDHTLKSIDLDGNKVLQNTNGPFTVSFPEKIESGSAVEIESEDYTISISLIDNKDAEAASKNEEKKNYSYRQLKTMSCSEYLENRLTNSNHIEYNEVYKDTDIHYDFNSSVVKESIIINKVPLQTVEYKYFVTAEGLTAIQNDDGSIDFYNQNDSDKHKTVFHLPAPFMFDSENNYSYDVETTLAEKENGYLLSYVPDLAWLQSNDRSYPVTLDPSIEVNSGIEDTYTFSADSYNNTYLGFEQQLKVGKTAFTGTTEMFDTFIKFNELPSIPDEHYVIDSALLMLTPKAYEGWWSSLEIGAYEITESWPNPYTGPSNPGLVYSNRPDSQNVPAATAIFTTNFTGSDAEGFEISELVTKWYQNPTENNGVRLSLITETDNPWDSITFHSSRSDHSPYLTIKYTPFVPATGVTITNRPSNDRYAIGYYSPVYNFTAEVYPANASNKEIIWESSNPEVGTISSPYGQFTPMGLGQTTITAKLASDPTIYNSFVLTIYNIPIETLTITDKPQNNQLNKGETHELSVEGAPENATDISIIDYATSWASSKPSVATVEGGLITAYSPGTTTIIAEFQGVSDSFELTVPYIPVSELYFANMPTNGEMKVGETWTFASIALPDNASNPEVVCTSSDPSVASVVGKKIIANKSGTTTIRMEAADNPDVFAVYDITVLSSYVIFNKPQNDMLSVGSTWRLVTDENIKINAGNSGIITADENGWITAVKPGKTVLEIYHVNNPGGFVRYEIVVTAPVIITGITDNFTMEVGDIYQGLGAYIPYETDAEIVWWSSNPEVADVTVDYVKGIRLCANSPGTTTIYANAPEINASASFTVSVGYKQLDDISIYADQELDDGVLYLGETVVVRARTVPLSPYAVIDWHSQNQNVIITRLSSTYVEVKANAEGDAAIWASSDGVRSYNLEFTVKKPRMEIAKKPNANYMCIGTSYNMFIETDPGYGNFEWISNNQNVASFSENGTLTAKNVGTTTISACHTVGERTTTVSFTLTVGRVSIGNIPSSGILFVDGNYNLSATVKLSGGGTSSDVLWTTTNGNIASASNGTLKGVSPGTVTIKAKYKNDDSIEGRFTITVKKTKSYIYYLNTEVDSWQGAAEMYRSIFATKYYGGNTNYIELIDLKSEEDFIEKWNSMGQNGFDIGYVMIHCHASPVSYGNIGDENDNVYNSDIREDFQNKDMVALVTSGCNAGHLDVEDNLGVTLAQKVNGAPVLASDGIVYFNYDAPNFRSEVDDHFLRYSSNTGACRTQNEGWIVYKQVIISGTVIEDNMKKVKTGKFDTNLSEMTNILDFYSY